MQLVRSQSTMVRYFSLVFVALSVAKFADSDMTCNTYDHCHDSNNEKTYKDEDAWISVNNTEGTCAECICMESKEYTVSCVELEVVNKSRWQSVWKDQPGSTMEVQKKSGTVISKPDEKITNTEVELSEDEAFKIRCQKGVIPTFDPLIEEVVVRHKHYYFMSRIMYCCKKESFYKFIDPDCKVVFDELCNSRVVSRDDDSVTCSKPFEFL